MGKQTTEFEDFDDESFYDLDDAELEDDELTLEVTSGGKGAFRRIEMLLEKRMLQEQISDLDNLYFE